MPGVKGINAHGAHGAHKADKGKNADKAKKSDSVKISKEASDLAKAAGTSKETTVASTVKSTTAERILDKNSNNEKSKMTITEQGKMVISLNNNNQDQGSAQLKNLVQPGNETSTKCDFFQQC